MNVPHPRPAVYQSYLLRLWRTDARAAWRVSVQSTTSAEIFHFVDLAALVAFLETGRQAGRPPGQGGEPM